MYLMEQKSTSGSEVFFFFFEKYKRKNISVERIFLSERACAFATFDIF